jgi:hypothetical protein
MTQSAPAGAQTPAFAPEGTVVMCLVAFMLSFDCSYRVPLPPPPPPPPPVEAAVTPAELEVESSEEAELRRLTAWECARFREWPMVCKRFFFAEPGIMLQPAKTISSTSHRCPCPAEPTPSKPPPTAPPRVVPKERPPHPAARYVELPSFVPDGGAGRVELPSFIPDGGAGRVELPSFIPDGGAGRVELPSFIPKGDPAPHQRLGPKPECWCPDIPLPINSLVVVKLPGSGWHCTCGPNQALMCSDQMPTEDLLAVGLFCPLDISPLCDLSVTQ